MAPKRGGGGGGSSSGGSVNTCPGAFSSTYEQAFLANDVLFFAVYLGIAVALCVFRKKGVAGKELLGLPYIGLIFFSLVTFACSIISVVLQQCYVGNFYSIVDWNIAITVFRFIVCYTNSVALALDWLLLLVIVYQLNTLLLKQLDRSNAVFKIVPAVLTGVMGLLTVGLLSLRAYMFSLQKTDGYLLAGQSRYDYYKLAISNQKFSAAYWALYFVTVIASGALALMTIMSLRKARKAGGDLIGWSVALTMSMMLWVIISLVFAAWALEKKRYTDETQIALNYVYNFAQALSCIFVLCIAKHASWRKPANMEQYDPNVNPNGQQYYYHQAPELVGNNHTVKP